MVQGPPRPIQPTSRDPEEIDLGDGHRVATYSSWRAFARGAQWEGRQAPGEARRVFNYARALTRKIASYVFSGPVTFTVATTTGDEDAAAAKWLNDFTSAEDLTTQDLALEIEAATIGDAAVKVTWDLITGRPRVVSVDPGSLIATWSPDNPRQPFAVSQAYELPGYAIAGVDPTIPVEQDRTYAVTEHWTSATWTLRAGDVERIRPNPYRWIPYVVLANNPHPRRFWGQSDLEDLKDVIRELNRELTTLGRIMELSGAPVAVIENVTGTEGLRLVAGAKWELPADAKAYLLDLLAGSGVQMHLGYLDQLRTTLHDLSETPRTAFGDTGRALSGAALEVEIQPLVQRARRKRASWERFYSERNKRLLDLQARYGGGAFAGRATKTVWPSILPSDTGQDVINNVALVGAGIRSRRTAIAELGHPNPDAELALIDGDTQHEEDQEDDRRPEDGPAGDDEESEDTEA